MSSIESNVSITLDTERRDSHQAHHMFQSTLKNIFSEKHKPRQPPPPQGLPSPMDYRTKGGDDESDDEPMPTQPTSGGTGHYAEPSSQPMNDDEMKTDSGHIAAVSSVNTVDLNDSPNYDSMYGRGSGHTAGYHGNRMSNVSTGSWKE